MNLASCVVLVNTTDAAVAECETVHNHLKARGYIVRQLSPDVGRAETISALFNDGFAEILLLDANVLFDPADVSRLLAHSHPFTLALCSEPTTRTLACRFAPNTREVTLGINGGLIEVRHARLGFAVLRRELFERIDTNTQLHPTRPRPETWFTPARFRDHDGTMHDLSPDEAFCERARRAGIPPMADTTIRLTQIMPYPYSWEDLGTTTERQTNITIILPEPAGAGTLSAPPKPSWAIPKHHPMRGPAAPLSPGFPRISASIVTYPANHASLELMLADFHRSDWGSDPHIFNQPEHWPRGKESASRNFRRALEQAVADDCDFALILEDDVRVCRHLRHNLTTLPLVARDQCDYLSLFMPDLVHNPWERTEAHLGYRLAHPRYGGPNRLWEKFRVWGSQAYLLSARFIQAALERWDQLKEGQDSRALTICNEQQYPLWYTTPCFAEHVPLVTAFGTPPAYAPDFDAEFRLNIEPGFQPAESILGWLAYDEGLLLYNAAKGRRVLELGTAQGRSTVCLGQSATQVVSVDRADQSAAAEWCRRYGLSQRIKFRQGDITAVCSKLTGPFGLVFIDTGHDAASVRRDINAALPLLEMGGRLAFHDYPDPGWPDVRRVVDEYAHRLGWKRIAQAGYVGLFQT